MESEKIGRYQLSRDRLDGKITSLVGSLQIYSPPKNLSKLTVHGFINIEMPTKIPNIWVRFWYKILLGWKWENLDGK